MARLWQGTRRSNSIRLLRDLGANYFLVFEATLVVDPV